jgi:hypothetical protein
MPDNDHSITTTTFESARLNGVAFSFQVSEATGLVGSEGPMDLIAHCDRRNEWAVRSTLTSFGLGQEHLRLQVGELRLFSLV